MIYVIVVIFFSSLNMLLTYARNILSFGHYINMFNKIAGLAMFCLYVLDVFLDVFRFFRLTIVLYAIIVRMMFLLLYLIV